MDGNCLGWAGADASLMTAMTGWMDGWQRKDDDAANNAAVAGGRPGSAGSATANFNDRGETRREMN